MKIKCPKCGNIFEGPVAFCPNCCQKLAMPEGAESAPMQAQYVQPVQPPVPSGGTTGKAIGFGITSLLLGLPSLVLEILVVVGTILSMMYVKDPSGAPVSIPDNAFWAAIISLGWLGVLALFVPCLLAFIFSIVCKKQKKVKGLAIPVLILGILGFVLYFVSLIFAIVGAVVGVAEVLAATTTF